MSERSRNPGQQPPSEKRHDRTLARSMARLNSLLDASRAMSEISTLQELLDTFIRFVTEQLEVDRASLMLVDESARRLELVSHRGLDHLDASSVQIDVGQGIAGTVADNGEPILAADAVCRRPPWQSNPDLSNSFISAPIELSVPLKASAKVLGVVNLTNRRSGEPFDGDDLTYVMTLSNHLAVAIEKVRQIEQLKQARRSLEETQDQLVLSERLRVVGEMAAGIAHDFNNMLAVILGRTQLSQLRLGQEGHVAEVRADLDTVRNTAIHGAEIVKRIQSYARSADRSTVPIDIRQALKAAVEMTRPRWKDQCDAEGRQIRIDYQLDEVGLIRGNIHELTQAMGNLLINAVEAMPRGGELILRAREWNGQAIVEISDTGVGMSEGTRARLFEPFFSTRPEGQGLGLGIIKEIVDRHGGEISVDSTPGKGSTFTLTFPLREALPEERVLESQLVSAPERSVRVLLVDDDDKVRGMLEEALEANGHHVVQADSGRRALELFESSEIDIVITDLSMEGMSGLDVARAVKDRNAVTPVILLSGWAAGFVDDNVRCAGVDHVLEKPCLIETLLSTVQGAIDQATKP